MVSRRFFKVAFFFPSILAMGIMVVLFFTLPSEPPQFKVGSDTTIWLNFTGSSLTVGGYITVIYTNPKEIVDIFYKNVSVSIFYNNIKDNSTTDQFLTSTHLPSIYVESSKMEKQTTLIHINVGIVNNTVDFGSGSSNFSVILSASTSYSWITLFHDQQDFIQVFYYPLISNDSTRASNILLVALPC